MLLGAHESAAGGPHRAIERAISDGCEAVAMFVKNQHRWQQREWTDEEVEKFQNAREGVDIEVIGHAAYLINLCSQKREVVEKSIVGLADELTRCQKLGVSGLVFHPGAPGAKRDEQTGIEEIAAGIDQLFDEYGHDFEDVTLLLENTAGQGSNLGWRFEHLRDIIGSSKHANRLGVCYDTCHAFAAGYDYSTPELYEAHWAEFHEVVGLGRLHAFHINDSKKECGTRVDRHDHPGDGFIGMEPFRWLVNDPRFANLPGLLETPPMDAKAVSYKQNLDILRGLRD